MQGVGYGSVTLAFEVDDVDAENERLKLFDAGKAAYRGVRLLNFSTFFNLRENFLTDIFTLPIISHVYNYQVSPISTLLSEQ
jgi:hypothetical protein